jgi:hypothetical protein
MELAKKTGFVEPFWNWGSSHLNCFLLFLLYGGFEELSFE